MNRAEPPVPFINAVHDPQSTSLLDSLASAPDAMDENDEKSKDPSLLELGEETLAHGRYILLCLCSICLVIRDGPVLRWR